MILTRRFATPSPCPRKKRATNASRLIPPISDIIKNFARNAQFLDIALQSRKEDFAAAMQGSPNGEG